MEKSWNLFPMFRVNPEKKLLVLSLTSFGPAMNILIPSFSSYKIFFRGACVARVRFTAFSFSGAHVLCSYFVLCMGDHSCLVFVAESS